MLYLTKVFVKPITYFLDSSLIVCEKPSGILVHPCPSCKNEKETLLSITRNSINSRVYPFQRLDRPVSGPVVFGLSPSVVPLLQEAWQDDKSVKRYHLLCRRELTENGEFTFSLKNESGTEQPALTRYWPLWTNGEVSFVKVEIKTGRHHQIRRHFSRRCFNLIGDSKYGKGPINRKFREEYGLERIFLHCSYLCFKHPLENHKIEIYSPLPENLQIVLAKLGVPLECIPNPS